MADFNLAHARTLRLEDATLSGEITCDTDGRTRFGISENAHPDAFPELVECDCERALVIAGEIMREHYWRFDGVVDQVANKLYDMAVNMGLALSSHQICPAMRLRGA
jgi:lysozyme family protein